MVGGFPRKAALGAELNRERGRGRDLRFVAGLDNRLNVRAQRRFAAAHLAERFDQFRSGGLEVIDALRMPDEHALAIAIEEQAGFIGQVDHVHRLGSVSRNARSCPALQTIPMTKN